MDEDAGWYCEKCDEYFIIIMRNLPELSVEFCPNCGSDCIRWVDEDKR